MEDVRQDEVVDNLQQLMNRIASELPVTQVIYVSVLKSSQMTRFWSTIAETNARIQKYADQHERISYLDLTPVVFDDEDQPRGEMMAEDGMHYGPAAYQAFADLLKPRLQNLLR
jgi:lysophospholipase L1-like esterase